jgi:YVTN family beta-propeller protein
MKKTVLKISQWFVVGATVAFTSCNNEPDKVSPQKVTGSVYVVCEGNFLSNEGKISRYNPTTNQSQIDVYKDANNVGLGDIVQSMTIIDTLAYIVVNNSNKIEIAGINSFKKVNTISNLALPRYLVQVGNNKAYLTEYKNFVDNGQVSVIDLKTNTIIKTIAVGKFPEKMIKVGNRVYVLNNGSNFVSVIDLNNESVSEISVGYGGNDMVLDGTNIYVLTQGKKEYTADWSIDVEKSTAATIEKINTNNNTVQKLFTFSSTLDSPSRLAIKNNELYFINNGLYKISLNSGSFNPTKLYARSLYGLGIDPSNGQIYVGTSGFTSNQKLIRLSDDGVAKDSATVGAGPNGFVFK